MKLNNELNEVLLKLKFVTLASNLTSITDSKENNEILTNSTILNLKRKYDQITCESIEITSSKTIMWSNSDKSLENLQKN